MKRGTKIVLGLGAALSLGLAAAAAGAQPYGYGGGMGWGMGGGMGWGMGPGMMGGGMGRGMGPGMMGGYGYGAEERLAGQKAALKITPAQESAWQDYANVVKKQFDARQEQWEAMHNATAGSSAERSDLHAKFMKQHAEQFEAVNAAYKNLYGVLTPEQRTILDQRPGYGPGPRGGRR